MENVLSQSTSSGPVFTAGAPQAFGELHEWRYLRHWPYLRATELMGRRPIVELSQFTIPGIESLYLVGPSMHPGGSVTFGGRAVAVKMMMDWKMDLKQHLKA